MQKYLPSNPLEKSGSNDALECHDKTIIENDSIESVSVSSLDGSSEDDQNKVNTSVTDLNKVDIERDEYDTNTAFPEIETAVAQPNDESLTEEVKIDITDKSGLDASTTNIEELNAHNSVQEENEELKTSDDSDTAKDMTPVSELLIFGDIPNLYEDSSSLGHFFSEVWHFKSKGVNYNLDLVCPQSQNVSVKYTLTEDAYHLESIKIKDN